MTNQQISLASACHLRNILFIGEDRSKHEAGFRLYRLDRGPDLVLVVARTNFVHNAFDDGIELFFEAIDEADGRLLFHLLATVFIPRGPNACSDGAVRVAVFQAVFSIGE